MIVNIRGTSGSGKTTLARWLMDHYTKNRISVLRSGELEEFPGPKSRPAGYIYQHPHFSVPDLFVCGHYEAVCGGCDNIPSFDAMYDLARRAAREGMNVLMEGLLLSAESRRMIELADDYDVLVIGLDVPVETCLAGVNERRRRKDPNKPDVNPKNTISKHKGVQSCMRKFTEAGMAAVWADRDVAREVLYECLIDLKEEA